MYFLFAISSLLEEPKWEVSLVGILLAPLPLIFAALLADATRPRCHSVLLLLRLLLLDGGKQALLFSHFMLIKHLRDRLYTKTMKEKAFSRSTPHCWRICKAWIDQN